jgi:hypothetical protein
VKGPAQNAPPATARSGRIKRSRPPLQALTPSAAAQLQLSANEWRSRKSQARPAQGTGGPAAPQACVFSSSPWSLTVLAQVRKCQTNRWVSAQTFTSRNVQVPETEIGFFAIPIMVLAGYAGGATFGAPPACRTPGQRNRKAAGTRGSGSGLGV